MVVAGCVVVEVEWWRFCSYHFYAGVVYEAVGCVKVVVGIFS